MKTRSETKYDAVVLAAKEEFKENGFKGASMDAIASRANVSKRTVYNYFPSKEGLFEKISAEFVQQALMITHFEYNPEQPLQQQLTAIAKQELEILCSEDYINLSKAIFSEFFHSPELGEEILAKMDKADVGLKTWIQAAKEDGRIKKVDSFFATTQFLSLLKSFCFWPVLLGHQAPSKTQQNKIIESAVEMFLDHYEVR